VSAFCKLVGIRKVSTDDITKQLNLLVFEERFSDEIKKNHLGATIGLEAYMALNRIDAIPEVILLTKGLRQQHEAYKAHLSKTQYQK
jgi:hypothetical protein